MCIRDSITLVKDTSLAFVLGIMEMFSQAKALAASQVSMVPYLVAGAIYWVFNLVVEMVLTRVEKKLNYLSLIHISTAARSAPRRSSTT